MTPTYTLQEAAELFRGNAPLPWSEDNDIITPGEQQRELIARTLTLLHEDARICLFPGAAGTGKTTTLKLLLKVLHACGETTIVACPTWKALGRAKESLEGAPVERVCTVHSICYAGGVETAKCPACGTEVSGTVAECPECGAVIEYGDELHMKERDRAHEGLASILVIDEASMCGEKIVQDLLDAIPLETRIIAVGDPHQLPPVMEHPGFALDQAPFELTDVYRQAQDSPVLAAATKIREQRVPFTYSFLCKNWKEGEAILATAGVPDIWADPNKAGILLAKLLENNSGDACAIVGTHKSRVALNDSTRNHIGFPAREYGPQVGERLVCRAGGPLLRNADTMNVTEVEPMPSSAPFPGWICQVSRPGSKWHTEIAVLGETWLCEAAGANATHRGLIPRSAAIAVERDITAERKECGKQINAALSVRVAEYKTKHGGAPSRWLLNLWAAEEARRVGAWAMYLSVHMAAVDTGYAVTCHQAQGSQYNEVMVIADVVDFIAEGNANKVYQWSYTALTRAVTRAYVIRKSSWPK